MRFVIPFSTFIFLLFISVINLYSKTDDRDISGQLIANNPNDDYVITKDTIHFQTQTLYGIIGSSIGLESMHTLDIDHDGNQDLICAASNSTGSYGNYWYILNYDSINKSYTIVWNSASFEHLISVLEVVDINDDGNFEIVIGFNNGDVQIYNAQSKKLQVEAKIDYESINSIDFADADNDLQKELVVSSRFGTHILDPLTLAKKYRINRGASNVKVGNIDDNEQNEIVLSSGAVYRITNNEPVLEWEFSEGGFGGQLILSDLNNDQRQEIILAQSWYKINIYDGLQKMLMNTFTTNSSIHGLLVQDVDNDGQKEIIYGDAQWGSVHALNSSTGQEIWAVNNPDSGVTNINISDIDNDGNNELIWSAGHNSTGKDHLFIYDLTNKNIEWKSKYIFGPFYAVSTGDLNGDKIDDIVTVTHRGESGDGSKVIVAVDGATRKVIWESNFSLCESKTIFDVLVEDLDSDGYAEIVVADNWGGTRFCIISGKDFSYRTLKTIYPVDNIQTMLFVDVDNDGTKEIIGAYTGRIYVFNPTGGKPKYTISIPGVTEISNTEQALIECDDVTGNGKKEIIFCNKSIRIINIDDLSIYETVEKDFTNITLLDYNRDGVRDIVASTNQGEIRIMDGKSKKYLEILKVDRSSIGAIKAIPFKGEFLFIYSCEGRINFYLDDNRRIVSQYFSEASAIKEGLKILETTSGMDLIFGGEVAVQAVSGAYFDCTSLDIAIEKNIVSCNLNDGFIHLNVTGGNAPYSYAWEQPFKGDTLSNLTSGLYTVEVSDVSGCSKTRRIDLPLAYIDVEASVTNENCNAKGTINLTIKHINEPYSINWSNGNDSLSNLNIDAGNYDVTILDNKNCQLRESFTVNADTINFHEYIQNVTCFGKENGSISLYPFNYYGQYNYQWDEGNNSAHISNLAAGNYNVTITDIYNCTKQLQFTITQPNKITYDVLTSPDVDSSQVKEGEVIIKNIEGSTAPYFIYWPEFSIYNDTLKGLTNGLYKFSISDANWCVVSDSVQIDLYKVNIQALEKANFKVYPNPATDYVIVHLDENQKAQRIFIVNELGQVVKSQSINDKLNQIDLSNLKSGIYIIGIQQEKETSYSTLLIR
jgi:phosphotransferase system IIB component